MFVVALLLVALLAAAYFHGLARTHDVPIRPAPPPRAPAPRAASAPRVPVPYFPPLEWASSPAADEQALRAKLRDRYVAARFPGLFGDCSALRETERVIQAARHLFEDGASDRAHELLELALEQTAAGKVLRLAQLEIAFLSRDPVAFTRLAREFRTAWPGSAEWPEIARLGSQVAPGAPLFGAATANDSRYGPSETPNWIQASWDLTSEVLAVDFHRVMTAAGREPA